jgi:hypothetical protein
MLKNVFDYGLPKIEVFFPIEYRLAFHALLNVIDNEHFFGSFVVELTFILLIV